MNIYSTTQEEFAQKYNLHRGMKTEALCTRFDAIPRIITLGMKSCIYYITVIIVFFRTNFLQAHELCLLVPLFCDRTLNPRQTITAGYSAELPSYDTLRKPVILTFKFTKVVGTQRFMKISEACCKGNFQTQPLSDSER